MPSIGACEDQGGMNESERIDLHNCPAVGCGKRLPLHILVCLPHWRLVPKRLQVAIVTLWREQPGSAAYLAARQDAIDAMNAAVGREWR